MMRRLFPNADFYSGLVHDAVGFPVEMFAVFFAIPPHGGPARPVAGDVGRPRAEDRPAAADLYRASRRDFVPIERRG